MNVPLCQVAQKRTMKFVRNYLGKTSAKNRQIWYSPRRNISRRDAVEFKAVSQFLSAYREWPRIASSSSQSEQWILLSPRARWRSASRHSYKMSAIHVNPAAGLRAVTHCQRTSDTPATWVAYITFIEHPNMWPRIARTKNNRLRRLGCHLTNGVPLAMTQSRSSSMWSSLSEANSLSGHWSSNQWMSSAAGVHFPAMWSLFFPVVTTWRISASQALIHWSLDENHWQSAFSGSASSPGSRAYTICYLINVTLALSTNCATPRRFIYLLQRLKDSKIPLYHIFLFIINNSLFLPHKARSAKRGIAIVYVVRPSVCDVDVPWGIDWTSSKSITRIISLGS